MTPEQSRRIRVESDFQEMLNIRGSIVAWDTINAFVDTSPHHAAFDDRSVVHPVASWKGGPHRRETKIRSDQYHKF
jgi:hypothetical protein